MPNHGPITALKRVTVLHIAPPPLKVRSIFTSPGLCVIFLLGITHTHARMRTQHSKFTHSLTHSLTHIIVSIFPGRQGLQHRRTRANTQACTTKLLYPIAQAGGVPRPACASECHNSETPSDFLDDMSLSSLTGYRPTASDGGIRLSPDHFGRPSSCHSRSHRCRRCCIAFASGDINAPPSVFIAPASSSASGAASRVTSLGATGPRHRRSHSPAAGRHCAMEDRCLAAEVTMKCHVEEE